MMAILSARFTVRSNGSTVEVVVLSMTRGSIHMAKMVSGICKGTNNTVNNMRCL